MADPKKALLDGGLILVGAGISILFISTDGNGENPIPVARGVMGVVLVTAVVSFLLGSFLRNVPFAVIAGIIITNLLCIAPLVRKLAYHSTDKYAAEAALMIPIIFAVEMAPTILLSSIGFGRLTSRFWRKRKLVVDKSASFFNDTPTE